MSDAQGGPPPGWPLDPQAGGYGPGKTEIGEVDDPGRLSFPMPAGPPGAAAAVPGTNLPADGGVFAGGVAGPAGAPVGSTVVDGVDAAPPLMPPGFGPAPPVVGATVVDDGGLPPYAVGAVPGAVGPPVGVHYVAPVVASQPKSGMPIWAFGALGALLIGGGLTTYFVAFDATDDAAPPEAVELPDKPKKVKSKKADEPEPIRGPVPTDDDDDSEDPTVEDPAPEEPTSPGAPPPGTPPPSKPATGAPPPAPPPPTQAPPPPPPKATPPPPPPPPPASGVKKRRRIKLGGN